MTIVYCSKQGCRVSPGICKLCRETKRLKKGEICQFSEKVKTNYENN